MTDGRVSAILGDGERLAVRRVVLATGGVSASAAWRARLFLMRAHALAVDEADGAGAAGAEADFADDLACQWRLVPVSHVVWPDGERGVFPHIIERGKPGRLPFCPMPAVL
jgi:hypothetical protein